MLLLSGFIWDDEMHMIECERQAFEEFCLGRPKAKRLWRMEFPYLHQLDIIFGVDRAKGTEVEDIDDAIDDLKTTTVNLRDDVEDLEGVTNLPTTPPLKKQKKSKVSFGSCKKDLTEKWACTMDDMNSHLDIS